MLPQVREWLETLDRLQRRVEALDRRQAGMLGEGYDLGGETINSMIRALAEFREVANEFRKRQIMIKDLRRGLIDFPSLREGKEVFLCWEKDEEDIEFWHDLESGFAGREKL